MTIDRGHVCRNRLRITLTNSEITVSENNQGQTAGKSENSQIVLRLREIVLDSRIVLDHASGPRKAGPRPSMKSERAERAERAAGGDVVVEAPVASIRSSTKLVLPEFDHDLLDLPALRGAPANRGSSAAWKSYRLKAERS